MHASRIINLVFMYRKILTLLSLLYTKPVYVHVLANLFYRQQRRKRKLKLKKALHYINNDRVHTGILLQANTLQFTGVSHNTSAIPDCKDWNCNRFFYIVKIFNNIFTTLN